LFAPRLLFPELSEIHCSNMNRGGCPPSASWNEGPGVFTDSTRLSHGDFYQSPQFASGQWDHMDLTTTTPLPDMSTFPTLPLPFHSHHPSPHIDPPDLRLLFSSVGFLGGQLRSKHLPESDLTLRFFWPLCSDRRLLSLVLKRASFRLIMRSLFCPALQLRSPKGTLLGVRFFKSFL